MFNIKKIREDFPMLKVKMQKKPLIFFDNASTTFKPKCVINAINKYYTEHTSNSHRGDYDLSYINDKKIAEARKIIADFINAYEKEIIFTSGTTMSINMIAFSYGIKNLKKNDEILITEAEHASNVLPWFEIAKIKKLIVKFIPLNKNGKLTLTNVKKSINKKTKIISIANFNNVLGFKVPIEKITKIAHAKKIIVIYDGAQYVPHHTIDVKKNDIDFLCFSGHKMCGPTGIGVLYGKYDLLNKMHSFMTGGGMNYSFNKNGEKEYFEPPEKFEAGTLHIAGILGLAEAVKYLNKIGMKEIEKYEKKLRNYAIKKMKKIKDIIIYNKNAEASIITINKKNIPAQDEATYLNSFGIAVRSGQHCAKMLPSILKTTSTIRISFYFYNTKEEIDKLILVLKKKDFLNAYF